MEEKLISRSTGSNMSKNFATLAFVTPFSLVAEVTWGFAQLQSRMAAHKVKQPLPAFCSLLYRK
jgi:hypothetical protein